MHRGQLADCAQYGRAASSKRPDVESLFAEARHPYARRCSRRCRGSTARDVAAPSRAACRRSPTRPRPFPPALPARSLTLRPYRPARYRWATGTASPATSSRGTHERASVIEVATAARPRRSARNAGPEALSPCRFEIAAGQTFGPVMNWLRQEHARDAARQALEPTGGHIRPTATTSLRSKRCAARVPRAQLVFQTRPAPDPRQKIASALSEPLGTPARHGPRRCHPAGEAVDWSGSTPRCCGACRTS
jgi:hypothetical protein